MTVNLYDFDGTIYDGDSTLDFYFYCLRKQKALIRYLPIQLFYTGLYFIKVINKKKWKEKFFIFLKGIDNIEIMVNSFWDLNYHKIKNWYLNKNRSNDIIISASPEFLLKEITLKIEVKGLIATIVDLKTGKFLSENCYGEEKVKRLLTDIPNVVVEEAYTDTYSDEPIIKLAQKGYLVKGDNIEPFIKK
ncbi:MAG: haloacid dehalogenase-like hydrolase [Bacilli bacterium]|nr:haloacid dehalogenase-like hydrolase [Bacilli bacterium]MDD4718566.1 haloacid dehalogenase-like hydrolase [Bacilli bacterium]